MGKTEHWSLVTNHNIYSRAEKQARKKKKQSVISKLMLI